MKPEDCEYCDGKLRRRLVTEVRLSADGPILIENIPIRVCNRCGERYYPAGVLSRIDEIAGDRKRIRRKVSVPVAKFSA